MFNFKLLFHYWIHASISLGFSDGISSDHRCWASFSQACVLLGRDWTYLLECTQGAVLVAVKGSVALPGCVAEEPTP